jgi:hypothetical protein
MLNPKNSHPALPNLLKLHRRIKDTNRLSKYGMIYRYTNGKIKCACVGNHLANIEGLENWAHLTDEPSFVELLKNLPLTREKNDSDVLTLARFNDYNTPERVLKLVETTINRLQKESIKNDIR